VILLGREGATPRIAGPAVGVPSRILVTRLRQIGDVILTLPVVGALRNAFPSARIDYLAEEVPAQAALGHPALTCVIVLRPWPGAAILPASPGVLARLRAARYDWVIDLYGNPRSAAIAAWSGAPVRIGPDRRGRRRLYTHPVPSPGPVSAVLHHLASLRAVGLSPLPSSPRLHLSGEELALGRARLDAALPEGPPRVGLHVGNRWAAKRWPEERFAALLRALPRLGARGAVLAGPGEEDLARRVAEGAPGTPVISGLPLRHYWGVLASLDALVTNDGSPLHAGPALRVPTVGLLGPTESEIWFPYSARDGHQLLCREIWCRPCHRHECARLDCLDWIEVRDAIEAVRRALGHAGTERASA
jgi:ADP-heptose:LPS heptosyltransferase